MLKAIIIDDEARGRTALRQKLWDYCPEVSLVGEAENAEEGIQLIAAKDPNIVFLDIQMPRIDGFKMLERLPRKNFQVIFTTAYDQYALKAIKFSAFDYLLKPVDIEELKSAVSRINNLQVADTEKKLQLLKENLTAKKSFHKIAISTQQGLSFFEVNDIVYLEAVRNYTSIHFNNHSKRIASKTLKDFEELLPSTFFFRIHHSYIININFINKYIKGDGGQVELTNGVHLDVSRRKKEEFLRVIAGR